MPAPPGALPQTASTLRVLSSSGKGEALAAELGGLGITGSNQSDDDLKRLVDGAMTRWGRIDALVNSAGHGPRAPVLELTDEQWHTGMDVYFLNVVRPTRLVTPIMQSQGRGAIVNISTFAAFEPDPVFPTSARLPRRSRGVHEALRRPLRHRQHPHEQRPAGLHRLAPGTGGTTASGSRWVVMATSTRSRSSISLLASDRAAYITGQNIRIDGGITRHT